MKGIKRLKAIILGLIVKKNKERVTLKDSYNNRFNKFNVNQEALAATITNNNDCMIKFIVKEKEANDKAIDEILEEYYKVINSITKVKDASIAELQSATDSLNSQLAKLIVTAE